MSVFICLALDYFCFFKMADGWNENIWKVVLHYSDVDLRDMLSLRCTCRQAYRAITPWIKISTTRFELLMKKIDSTGNYHSLDQWQCLEKDIDSFIEMYVTKNELPVLTGVPAKYFRQGSRLLSKLVCENLSSLLTV